MSPYVYDPARSYPAHLQHASAVEGGDAELPLAAARLIGSPQIAPAEGAEAVVAPAAAPAFQWERPEWLMASESFAASLTELKHGAQTSAEMWAFEQFDVARDAFRRELWPEAAEYLDRAIHGDDRHAGYELDYRFHFLLGLIRLGSLRHHDPALIDPERATESFLLAGRYAKSDHPAEAARAFFAAGWACYVRGRIEEAQAHTGQAVLLDPAAPEIRFQAAKFFAHAGLPDQAGLHLAQAIAREPAFAAAAVLDGDFAPLAEKVSALIEAEREEVGRRASQALQLATQRVVELGVTPPDPAAGSAAAPDGAQDFSASLALLELARAAFRENSLYGYRRAAALAAHADEAMNAIVARGQKARRLAEDALRTAEEEAAQIASVQVGTYRLGTVAVGELHRATELMRQARVALAAGTLPGYLEAEKLAGRALAVLGQTVEHYKASALQQALAEYAELERKIDALQVRSGDGGGSAAKACAAIGAIVALFPGGCLSFFSFRDVAGVHGPDLVLRVGLSVAIFAGVGALLGALFAPVLTPDSSPGSQLLDERKAALKQTIAALRAFSLQTHRAA
jgi:tetratricopeptide (TPR) repeat protein